MSEDTKNTDEQIDIEENEQAQAKPVNDLISVVIPVASWDKEWKKLLQDLEMLPDGTEIIFSVSQKDASFDELPDVVANLKGKKVKWVRSESGRAKCLNTGADAVSSKFVWFLHADTRFTKDAYNSLKKSVKKYPEGLHYFHLRFLTDGPNLMLFNEIGVRIRSRLFKTPFGDQGFCIKKDLFDKIGQFPVSADYGEDHIFVWHAKQAGVRLYCTGETLLTSARKYKKNGWLNSTLRHQKMWISQALPEWKKLMKGA
jgi:GT2 family glycosyltransferase